MEVWRKGSKTTLAVAPTASEAQVVAENEDDARSGRLGLAVRPLTPEERARNDGEGGLLVERVAGPAARAGVMPGDLVLSFNGNPVKSVDQLREFVDKGGKRIALLIQRQDRQLFVPIELG